MLASWTTDPRTAAAVASKRERSADVLDVLVTELGPDGLDADLAAVTAHLFGGCRRWPDGRVCPDPFAPLLDDGAPQSDVAEAAFSFAWVVWFLAVDLRDQGLPVELGPTSPEAMIGRLVPVLTPDLDALAQLLFGIDPESIEPLALGGWSEDGRMQMVHAAQSTRERRETDQLRDEYMRDRTGLAKPGWADGGRRGGKKSRPRAANERVQERRSAVEVVLSRHPTATGKVLHNGWRNGTGAGWELAKLLPGHALPSPRTLQNDLQVLRRAQA